MSDIKALCESCAYKEICEYTEKSFDLTENIKIEHPFSVDVRCKYFKHIISNSKTRTDGI